eukprot:229703-Amphidinium_carterae.1
MKCGFGMRKSLEISSMTSTKTSSTGNIEVMECMEGGELFDRVTERRKFNEKDAADAVWQMLLAVNYIHTHHIVHRDLKLEISRTQAPDTLQAQKV